MRGVVSMSILQTYYHVNSRVFLPNQYIGRLTSCGSSSHTLNTRKIFLSGFHSNYGSGHNRRSGFSNLFFWMRYRTAVFIALSLDFMQCFLWE